MSRLNILSLYLENLQINVETGEVSYDGQTIKETEPEAAGTPVARHNHNRGGVHKPKKGKGSYRRERVELHGE